MNDISQKLKETLLGLINNQDLSECVRAPDKDFTRNRKLSYAAVCGYSFLWEFSLRKRHCR